MKTDKFYANYTMYDTELEMYEHLKKFPHEPVDMEYFRKFFDDRLKEIQMNIESNPHFTNKMAFMLLRLSTEWITYMEMTNDNI